MDPLEEQKQEIEVLQSIYPDELELVSPTQFSINVALETVSDTKHTLVLGVEYPPKYPEEAPRLNIKAFSEAPEEEENDSDSDDDTEKFVSLAETIELEKTDLAQLLAKLQEEAELNLGMPSVFALVALLKDEAEILFQQKVDSAQQEYDEKLLAQEREEQKKFHGTKVTKESYAEWRKKFREEMQFELKDKKRYEEMHNGKMTGREIFEKGLAGTEDDLAELADAVAKTELWFINTSKLIENRDPLPHFHNISVDLKQLVSHVAIAIYFAAHRFP